MQLPHDYGATGGIASRLRRPIHGGQVEAINSTIKVITRMAYGYRDSDSDSDYFFLKIKAAFPGLP